MRCSSRMDVQSKENELNDLKMKRSAADGKRTQIQLEIHSKQTLYASKLESIGKDINSLLSFASPETRSILESLRNSIQLAASSGGKRVSIDDMKQLEQIILSIRMNLEKEKEAALERRRIQEIETTKVKNELRDLEISEMASQKSLQNDIISIKSQITSRKMQLQVRISEDCLCSDSKAINKGNSRMDWKKRSEEASRSTPS